MTDRTRWARDDVAATWARSFEARNRMMAAATERMLALAGVSEGARVLDLGTGTGDTALLVAERVGPRGEVLATDVSAAMVEAAKAAIARAGASNVTARVMDAGSIDVDAASFDAVVARNVLMFVPNVAAAFRGIRRALRASMRFGAVVWAPLDENPFHAIPIGHVRALGRMPASPPEVVRAFSLSDGAALRRTLAETGFVDVVIERVATVRSFATAAEARAHLEDQPLYRDLFVELDEEERARALAAIEQAFRAFERPEGCLVPAMSLVVSGRA